VRPSEAGWPTDAEWRALSGKIGGRLEPVSIPALPSESARKLLSNQIWLGDQPGLTEISGWVDAWTSAPSAYVVKAKTAADVSTAVRFAARRGVRMVVKGGGHSYLGGSNAPDSLLIWTRGMDVIEMHDAFTPIGCDSSPVPAVSVGAGCTWGRVYDAVTTRGGRYVQGGGCTTVGVAGLVQGGGFGSFSKRYGLAAGSLLEAEIVTADGQIRTINRCRDPDLFWALKGGGGGTFGVVTRLTLRTHDLPEMFGAQRLTIKAASDDAFKRLLARFVVHYADHLFNPHWGEQVFARPDNTLACEMVFQGLDETGARVAWQEFAAYAAASPVDYQVVQPLLILGLRARSFWDRDYLLRVAPSVITVDDRPEANPRDFWWEGDGSQASASWACVTSAWLPASLLRPESQAKFVDAWFEASRHWPAALHFNKGLAGASAETLAASQDTSINPQVLNAFALAIFGSPAPSLFPFLPAPDLTRARANATRVQAAMKALRTAAPDAGSYLSESDYFKQSWGEESWGEHWPRLERIKRRYDPRGLFLVHHGVGSAA
jgi:FAD/FMN-containing dehydrogenase